MYYILLRNQKEQSIKKPTKPPPQKNNKKTNPKPKSLWTSCFCLSPTAFVLMQHSSGMMSSEGPAEYTLVDLKNM